MPAGIPLDRRGIRYGDQERAEAGFEDFQSLEFEFDCEDGMGPSFLFFSFFFLPSFLPHPPPSPPQPSNPPTTPRTDGTHPTSGRQGSSRKAKSGGKQTPRPSPPTSKSTSRIGGGAARPLRVSASSSGVAASPSARGLRSRAARGGRRFPRFNLFGEGGGRGGEVKGRVVFGCGL